MKITLYETQIIELIKTIKKLNSVFDEIEFLEEKISNPLLERFCEPLNEIKSELFQLIGEYVYNNYTEENEGKPYP